MEPQGSGGSAFRAPAVMVFVLLAFFTLVLMVLSFPAGLYSVFVGPLGQYSAASTAYPYFWVGPALFYAPFSLPVGADFLAFTLVYVAMLLYAGRKRKGLLQASRGAVYDGFGTLFTSPLAVVLVSTGFLVFGGSLIDDVVSSAGAPIGNVTGDPLSLLVGFTASPLVEEVGFRVCMIGLVAFILSLGRPASSALKALWRPSVVLEGGAVASASSIFIWAALGFSAVTFGACHVICGGTSWDIGKFPEAAFGGLVLGYLYIRYGLHVAVLAHWGVDYVGSVFSFYGQAAYGIPWNSNTAEFIGQYVVDIDFLLLFGLASFLVVVYLALSRLGRRSAVAPPSAGSSYPPAIQAGRQG